MEKQGSSMVGVQIFKELDGEKDWKSVKVSSYMPVFLSGDQNDQNIEKRIKDFYLKGNSEILKIRWHYRENPEQGYWVYPELD